MVKLTVNKNIEHHENAINLLARLKEKCYEDNRLFSCVIELLTRCQLRCTHCLIPQHNQPGLSRKVIFNLIDQLADLRCPTVCFTGGEIFLRSDLLDIIKHASKRNLFIRLKTNGALITKSTADKLADNAIMQIDVSLYGPNAAIHDRITGSKGSFRSTINAVRLLKKRNLNVEMIVTFMKQNASYFKAISDLCASLNCGITYSSFILPHLNGNLKPLKLMVTNKQRSRINNYFQGGQPKVINSALEDTRDMKNKSNLCRTVWSTMIYICSNGDVNPCTILYQKYGNILQKPLSKILKSPLRDYLSRKISINDIEDCSACYRRNECENCRALAHIDTKEILGNSRLICYYMNMRDSQRRYV